MNSWDAFRIGLSRALRYRQVLLLLFAVNVVSALLLGVLPALALATDLGHRPAIRQAADGVDAWLVIETVMSPVTRALLGEGGAQPDWARGLQRAALLGLVTAAALPLLAWLPSTFLTGGTLLAYAEAAQPGDEAPASVGAGETPRSGEALRAPPFRWRRFLWGCWHWFGPFLLLSLGEGIVSVVVFLPLILVAAAAVAAVGGWLAWVVVPLLALGAALWLALVECSRTAAVVGGTRNVARALGQAARFILRHPLPVAGLYGLALLLLILLHALYRWGLRPHLPLAWWPLVLLVQQAFVLARLWARLARLAGGVALYQETGRPGSG